MNIIEDKLQIVVDKSDEEIDKINGLGQIIATCGKTLKFPGQSRTYGRWAKKESIGRRTLEKYIEIFEQNENVGLIANELAILKQAMATDVMGGRERHMRWTVKETSLFFSFFLLIYVIVYPSSLLGPCRNDCLKPIPFSVRSIMLFIWLPS